MADCILRRFTDEFHVNCSGQVFSTELLCFRSADIYGDVLMLWQWCGDADMVTGWTKNI